MTISKDTVGKGTEVTSLSGPLKTTHMQIEVLDGGFVLNYDRESSDGQSDFNREILVTERKLIDRIKTLLKDTSAEAAAE